MSNHPFFLDDDDIMIIIIIIILDLFIYFSFIYFLGSVTFQFVFH